MGTRRITPTWFYDRSPTITARQADEIYKALLSLGVIDAAGNLQGDPRVGQPVGERLTGQAVRSLRGWRAVQCEAPAARRPPVARLAAALCAHRRPLPYTALPLPQLKNSPMFEWNVKLVQEAAVAPH